MSATSGDRFAGFNAWAYLDKDRPTTTWWVRFGKGQATGPFSTQEAALSFVFSELVKMGVHGGFRAVGQFTQEPVVYDHNEDGDTWRSQYDGAWGTENLVATWAGGGSAQIFKKVSHPKRKRR